MTGKAKEPEHDQRVDPRPDFDFEKEKPPDNSVPPVGQPTEEKGK
jgi:hypothetical protein